MDFVYEDSALYSHGLSNTTGQNFHGLFLLPRQLTIDFWDYYKMLVWYNDDSFNKGYVYNVSETNWKYLVSEVLKSTHTTHTM